ncbi:MAG: C4-type zinc ribbon domain-containing protein [Ignavibacteriota bacterium]|nr:C4-type zinc ribbon domain-containing protein [Ignavibacteriota bacterium]
MDESNENIVNASESTESGNNESNLPDAKILEYFEEGAIAKKESYVKILLMLYELTKIDEELAEIDDEKGDLPVRIENLKERMAVVEVHLTEDKAKLKTFESEEKALNKENKNLDDKVTKYDESKYKAKNNKEYDEITKQIDAMMETTDKNDARLKELKSYQENLVKGILEMSKSYEELKAELKEDTSHLNSLNKQFEEEENELIEKRKVILEKLEDKHKTLYERINGSLKGEATAIVRKGNCSGCYNSVPPQREIEIRVAEDIFLCQSCGRIMIDEKLIENI